MGDFRADLRTSGIYREVIGRGLFRQPQQLLANMKRSLFQLPSRLEGGIWDVFLTK